MMIWFVSVCGFLVHSYLSALWDDLIMGGKAYDKPILSFATVVFRGF